MSDLGTPRTWRSRASSQIRAIENYLGGEPYGDSEKPQQEGSLASVAITTLLIVGLAVAVLELWRPLPGVPRSFVMLGLVICLTTVVALARRAFMNRRMTSKDG